MTREEWKALYYPVPATEACGTALEAAEHSLRKWRGIAAHPMARYEHSHSDKCALCQFSKIKKNGKIPQCARCPLVQSGHLDCTELRSAWYAWTDGDCGQRIIRELEETVEWCKKQEDEHAGK